MEPRLLMAADVSSDFATAVPSIDAAPISIVSLDNSASQTQPVGGSVRIKEANPRGDQDAYAISLPSDFPGAFSVAVEYTGERFTLDLEKSSAFGENTRFLIDNGSGSLVEIAKGIDRSYIGTVQEHPGFYVSATLTEQGLMANIIRPNQDTIEITPSGEGLHQIGLSEAGQAHDHNEDDYSIDLSAELTVATTSTDETAASTTNITTAPLGALAASGINGSTATLPPARVSDVREFEVGVEIGSAAFLNNYGGDLAFAQSVVQGLPGNLNARYVNSTGIRFRLGTVIIRTTAGSDPFQVSNGTDSGGLSAFRNYWNSNPGEVGSTHDLAVYHVRGAPSGLAYVNSVGTSSRYALSASNAATSWADGTLAHEFGHSWNLPHVNSGQDLGMFYESKPRDNNGSNTAGGSDVFVSVMDGRGDHNIGRLATDEANRVYNARQNKLQFGDLIADPGEIKPFGQRDEATAFGGPITVDVIANDHDVNNDVLDVQILDTVSQRGGTISLSAGTGPGGRNELIYTPPAGVTGSDFFHYTVFDTTGKTDWGAVYVTLEQPLIDPIRAFQFDFGPNTDGAFSGVSVDGTPLPANLTAANSFFNAVTQSDPDFINARDSKNNPTGVSLTIRETADGGTFDFDAPGTNLRSRSLTSVDNPSGIYDNDLFNDLFFTNQQRDLGVKVSGLDAGIYAVYALLQETLASAQSRTYSVDIGVGADSTASFGDFGLGNATDTPATAPDTFIDNQNYYSETITVVDGQSVFVLIDSLNSDFVTLQGLQIVKIENLAPTFGGFQFDFGPNAGGAFSGNVVAGVNLPGNLSSADSVFNAVTESDSDFSNALDSHGNASGVSLAIREAAGGGTYNFDAAGTNLRSRSFGSSDNPFGIYDNNLFNDLFFTNQEKDLGVKVSGLHAGTYAVYALLQETLASAQDRTYSVDIGVGTNSTASFGDFGLGNTTDIPASAPDTFIDNQNFYSETITVVDGQSVFVLIDSLNSDFVSLQGLQIVRVTPRNIAPTAINDAFTVAEDGTLMVSAEGLLGNDLVGSNGPLAVNITPVVDPQNGSVMLQPNGAFTYTPTENFVGTDSFEYEISDGVATATAAVSIEVTERLEVNLIQIGSPQNGQSPPTGHSIIDVVRVEFDGLATVDPGAFVIQRTDGAGVVDVPVVVALDGSTGSTIAELRFTPDTASVNSFGSLDDGTYRLQIVGANIRDAQNVAIESTITHTDNFFAKFADMDSSGSVGLSDFAVFRSAFGSNDGDLGFVDGLDANRDGKIGLSDFASFRAAFGN